MVILAGKEMTYDFIRKQAAQKKPMIHTDFKEELLSNMDAKIENLVRKGMDTGAAFAKASAELGDVSALAGNIIDGLSQTAIPELGAVIDGFSGATVQNFEHIMTIVPMVSMIIPFILPGIGLLVYLCLSEKDRLKPWAKDFRDKTAAREMALWNDPAVATRFGMFSGAIWIFAIGLFLLLGFIISFKFSWLIFIFAVAFQLVIQGVMSKGETSKFNPSRNSA